MAIDQDSINRDLQERTSGASKFQAKLLTQMKGYINAAADHMSSYWHVWDEYDKIYRGYRIMDREDKKAASKKESVKIVVPMTYAQAQTGIAFLYTLFNQRERFFELKGTGVEDERAARGMEIDLAYQLRKTKFPLVIYNWIQDAFKYGFGVVKHSWEIDHTKVRSRVPIDPSTLKKLGSFLGIKSQTQFEEKINSIISFEGSQPQNISPYSFFPDP